jgi:hypothetical protein
MTYFDYLIMFLTFFQLFPLILPHFFNLLCSIFRTMAEYGIAHLSSYFRTQFFCFLILKLEEDFLCFYFSSRISIIINFDHFNVSFSCIDHYDSSYLVKLVDSNSNYNIMDFLKSFNRYILNWLKAVP